MEGHSHPHDRPDHGHDEHQHLHDGERSPGESPRPTDPSRSVVVDVGEHTGALVLMAPSDREGLEVEIHPAADPGKRTHVWVLPRAGRDGTVYAAIFPSLAAGEYTVLEPDGSVAKIVSVPANQVTTATWG